MDYKQSQSAVSGGVSRQMLRRGAALAAVFGIGCFALLLARLYRLQIRDHSFYEKLAIEQQLRSTPSAKRRGVIYDTNGNVLAVSATVDNVYLSPAEIEAYGEDRALIARGLSEILGLDYDEVYEKSGRQGSWYVTAARRIERDKAQSAPAAAFDQAEVNQALVSALFARKGMDVHAVQALDMAAYRQAQYDLLAEGVRANMDMELVYRIIEEGL